MYVCACQRKDDVIIKKEKRESIACKHTNTYLPVIGNGGEEE
jgi:hypothetical protein